MKYYAHSGNADDWSDWQTLQDHLLAVAELAAAMAAPLGLEKPAFLAGLFHDLGKYTAGFQKRLTGADIRVDHSTAGAVMLSAMTRGPDKAMAEIIARGGVDRNRHHGPLQGHSVGRLLRGGVDRNCDILTP